MLATCPVLGLSGGYWQATDQAFWLLRLSNRASVCWLQVPSICGALIPTFNSGRYNYSVSREG